MNTKLLLVLAVGFGLGFMTANVLQPKSETLPVVSSADTEVNTNANQEKVPETALDKAALAQMLADAEQTSLSEDKQELAAEVQTLRENVRKLAQSNQTLIAEKKELTGQFEEMKSAFISATMNQNDNAPSKVTDEEMSAHIPAPYNEMLVRFKGTKRDQIDEFYKQPEDFEWGYEMQTNISDFILNHHLSQGVELAGVTCKIDKCELRVHEFNPDDKTWHQIFHAMTIEPWWLFQSTHSSSTSVEGEQGVFIYAFMSKSP